MEQRGEAESFVATKLSDLAALASAFGAIALTIALSALADAALMTKVLE